MAQCKDDRRREAVESLVRDCKKTAERMGNVGVTEGEIRRYVGDMAEKADRRQESGDFKNRR